MVWQEASLPLLMSTTLSETQGPLSDGIMLSGLRKVSLSTKHSPDLSF